MCSSYANGLENIAWTSLDLSIYAWMADNMPLNDYPPICHELVWVKGILWLIEQSI